MGAREVNVSEFPSIESSMLWAAVADAMGWISELAETPEVIKKRAGSRYIKESVRWRRRIGGMRGVSVSLPPGTYSDDTQLRLAVCRSISTGGNFDVEAFAKIELPVWLNYALGAGVGSKVAAQNLSKKGVTWFSNFFEVGSTSYVKGGGNGAAMRIQPHVLAAPPGSLDLMLSSVLRNAVTTHGHVHGFGGAYFHALCLHHVFRVGKMPGPDFWVKFGDSLIDIPAIVSADPQLSAFWIKSWEAKSGRPLRRACAEARDELQMAIQKIYRLAEGDPSNYSLVIDALDLRRKEVRGSGLLTSLAAAASAWFHREFGVEGAVIQAVNEIGSDTDTIATMSAAMLGSMSPSPEFQVQDRQYIVMEAERLGQIRSGKKLRAFHYPDLADWRPPTTQASAVAVGDAGFVLRGLGPLVPVSKEISNGEDVWQWMELEFGQTILAKRRSSGIASADAGQLPGSKRHDLIQSTAIKNSSNSSNPSDEGDSGGSQRSLDLRGESQQNLFKEACAGESVESIIREIEKSGFDARTLGEALLGLMSRSPGVEYPVALTSLIYYKFIRKS